MDPKKKFWCWMAGVLLAIIIILAFVLFYHKPAKKVPLPVYAPQGQLVSGFPKDLILDPSVKADQSYSISYSASINQYTANYTSGESMLSLYNDYQTYFKNNGWTIVNGTSSAACKTSCGLYVSQGTNNVSVAVIDTGTSRTVAVTYLKK